MVSEWRTTLLQAPFRSGSQESEITLLIYYHLKPFSSSGFSTSSLWYSINWFTGVGGSFVKHITRYKPAIITTPKNREVLVTVAYSDSHSNRQIHHLLCTKLPCTFASESQKLRQVFFYKIMQWHRLKTLVTCTSNVIDLEENTNILTVGNFQFQWCFINLKTKLHITTFLSWTPLSRTENTTNL